MAHNVNREALDNIGQRGKIEHVFRDAIERAWRPCAIAVPTQVERIDVLILAQRPRHPVPAPGMIQAAVNQNHNRLAFGSPIPKLKFQPVRIEIMRYGFYSSAPFSTGTSLNVHRTPAAR